MDLRATWIVPAADATHTDPTLCSVEVRTDPALPFSEVARVPVTTNTVVLTDQAPGHYEVRVRAFDGTHYGEYSEVAAIDLATTEFVPNQVTGLVLTQE